MAGGGNAGRGNGAGGALQRLLKRRIGPWSGRVWGLVLNLVANAVTLWGVSLLLRTGSGWHWIVIGGVATAVCMAALALPDRSGDPGE
ncbi:MAG: hypothetical protein OXI83_07205 [Gemmatimonadota bacterium]|nr:hypothetical protein [Gemmatimonadota bacterium]